MRPDSPEKNALLETLLQTNSLALAAESAAAVLKNSLAVIDSSYQILAKGGSRDFLDDFWSSRSEGSHWNYEFVAKVNKLIDRNGNVISMPALLTDVAQKRRRLESLMQDGTHLGFVVVLESESRLEDTDEDTYDFVRQVLSKAMAMDRALQFHSHAGHDEGILTDMLNNRFKDHILLREKVRGTGFDKGNYFRLYAVDLTGYASDCAPGREPGHEQGGPLAVYAGDDPLKKRLHACFRQCWSVSEKENIIILAAFERNPDEPADPALPPGPQGSAQSEPDAELAALLGATGMLAGKSPAFSDLLLVPHFKGQALRALELSQELAGTPFHNRDSVLFSYEDYKMPDLLSRLSRNDVEAYCSGPVQRMFRHDRDNGSEYLKTVFHYLNSGKSIAGAAKALFLHPNTVYYRVTRARELFGLDFSNEYTNLHINLSCIMLLYFQERITA